MAMNKEKNTIATSPSLLFRCFLLLTIFLAINGRTNAALPGQTEQDMKNHTGSRVRDLDGVGDEWGVVERQGNQFVVGGQPFYFNGFNTYWLLMLAVDQSTRGKVSDVFRQASSIGLTVCRTWAFNDGGWRALQKSPSVYDEDVFKAFDFVLSEARKYKIRLVLPLVNNWESYGGKAQYVRWGIASGLNLTSYDDFFSDPTVKGYYKAHVKVLLNRANTFTNITYKDDPTVFAWELMNEPRCPSDPSGDKLQEWIQEMAFHVKSIDSVHLLGTGTEGFYGPPSPGRLQLNPNTVAGQVGTDFIRNHKALGIDYASAHLYPDAWLPKSASNDYAQFATTWIQAHTDDADAALRMPVVFGEFGVSSSKAGRSNSTQRNTFIAAVYAAMLNSTKRGGSGGGCLLWQVFPEGTEYMDDGYAVVLTKAPNTSNMLALQSKRMQIFNSRCSWRCHWSCKKKNRTDHAVGLPRDEL
ncbi:Cellulase (glycosyl hydrolase family 5) [Musa troglodytarum]|uniref:mannan endo-1,4-beta-mannosidase n=1 Tax=Musa troglodytarum TaxID=320322 RepID=A0A9E7FCA1_9LILI|nr:Cellulase (glycosyl hydrolase family 5) [Musa troglodytarum]